MHSSTTVSSLYTGTMTETLGRKLTGLYFLYL